MLARRLKLAAELVGRLIGVVELSGLAVRPVDRLDGDVLVDVVVGLTATVLEVLVPALLLVVTFLISNATLSLASTNKLKKPEPPHISVESPVQGVLQLLSMT